jgi:hypothetical protein
MIKSKIGQRLVGLGVLAICAGFMAWSWHTAMNEGNFNRKAAIMFPAFAVIGLGMILFPIDVDRFRAERGVEKPESFAHLPRLWKLITVLAIATGFGNLAAISQL